MNCMPADVLAPEVANSHDIDGKNEDVLVFIESK